MHHKPQINLLICVIVCCFLSSGVAEARKRHHHVRHKHHSRVVSHADKHVYRGYHKYDRDTPSPYDYRPEDKFLLPKDAVPYLETDISKQIDQIRMPYETLVQYLAAEYKTELDRIASKYGEPEPPVELRNVAIGLVSFSGLLLVGSIGGMLWDWRKHRIKRGQV